MPIFDPLTSLKILHVQEDFVRMNRLDDLWTFYLQESKEVPPAHIEALTQIAEEIVVLLARVDDYVNFLQHFIDEKKPGDFDLAFKNTIAATSLSNQQRETFLRIVRNGASFEGFAQFQLNELGQRSRNEAGLIQTKMKSIREGRHSIGDFSLQFKCALRIAILVAAIIGLVHAGVILLPAVTAAVANGASAMEIITVIVGVGGIIPFLHEGLDMVHSVAELFDHHCFDLATWKLNFTIKGD